MASFNKIIIIGNLTRDPEYKAMTTGRGLCKLSIASNRQYRNKQTNALVSDVCYIEVEVWGPQADNCKQYLQKGRPVLVEGYLKQDNWESEGQKRSKHAIVAENVVFLGSRSGAEASEDTVFGAKSASTTPSKDNSMNSSGLFSDENPFEDELPF